MTFERALRLFREDRIHELSEDEDGLRFLKLRSLSRRDHLERVLVAARVPFDSLKATALLQKAYESDRVRPKVVDRVIRDIYESERAERRRREPRLVSELYKMSTFDWGGLHQNSLEKTIVDNYVKKITSYDVLSERIENEIYSSMRGYVLCLWYNHWTSIIIEDVFPRP